MNLYPQSIFPIHFHSDCNATWLNPCQLCNHQDEFSDPQLVEDIISYHLQVHKKFQISFHCDTLNKLGCSIIIPIHHWLVFVFKFTNYSWKKTGNNFVVLCFFCIHELTRIWELLYTMSIVCIQYILL